MDRNASTTSEIEQAREAPSRPNPRRARMVAALAVGLMALGLLGARVPLPSAGPALAEPQRVEVQHLADRSAPQVSDGAGG